VYFQQCHCFTRCVLNPPVSSVVEAKRDLDGSN
jgi:hypothetical protein